VISGQADDGWGKVADAFRSNFERGCELGSACAVYADGKLVVDLWGGAADRTGRPWEQNTVALVFSTTKGATAICAHMLVESGALDLDAPVASYWPEFAQAGKAEIPVRWLLSHQAGLPVIDTPLTLEEACAWAPVIHALEAQEPLWPPGEQHFYHPHTYGFLVGEVVRRVSGKTVGTFFRDRVATPLALDAWIGLPEEIEPRVAQLEYEPPPADGGAMWQELGLDPATARSVEAALRAEAEDPGSVTARSGTLGGAFPDITVDAAGHNLPVVRAAEFPSSNMVADARSVARMYAATIGIVDGHRLLQPQTVAAMSQTQTGSSTPYLSILPPILDTPIALGFWTASLSMPHIGPRSFGHPGAGGSLGLADPEAGIGFGYVMNRMGDWSNARALVDAVADCLG
jgi:CubicO group peptidase (beta-lactamase class C family)